MQLVGDLNVCMAACTSNYWEYRSYNKKDRWCVDKCSTKFIDLDKQCVNECSTDYFVMTGNYYECQDWCDGYNGRDVSMSNKTKRCV